MMRNLGLLNRKADGLYLNKSEQEAGRLAIQGQPKKGSSLATLNDYGIDKFESSRAERRAGEMLREVPREPGERTDLTSFHDGTGLGINQFTPLELHDVTPPPKLAELGITPIQSHRWQGVSHDVISPIFLPPAGVKVVEKWVAREMLSTPAWNKSDGTIVPSLTWASYFIEKFYGNQWPGTNVPQQTWASYCESIGIEKRTANRWLASVFGNEMLSKSGARTDLVSNETRLPTFKEYCEDIGIQKHGTIVPRITWAAYFIENQPKQQNGATSEGRPSEVQAWTIGGYTMLPPITCRKGT